MNPEVSIDRILTLQSCFIAVGSDSEPGLHQQLLDSSRRMWSIHQPTKCSNCWFRFTGYRAAKQQDSDLAPDSRHAPSGGTPFPLSGLQCFSVSAFQQSVV